MVIWALSPDQADKIYTRRKNDSLLRDKSRPVCVNMHMFVCVIVNYFYILFKIKAQPMAITNSNHPKCFIEWRSGQINIPPISAGIY